MQAFDLLTEKDKELIGDYIDAFSNGNHQFVTDHWRGIEKVLSDWNHAKSQYLCKMFDNQLILKRFFTYQMPIEGLEREYNNLCSKEEGYILTVAKNWLRKIWTSDEFINDEDIYITDSILGKDTLINNAYTGKSFTIQKKGIKKPLKVLTGMKPMRIIHSIAEMFDKSFITPSPETNKSDFDELCIWHSKIFNQANMDGELCLSIHPLDYMTMSDNNNNWESCMTWTRHTPGEYRAGTVECMNSPYIVVAYLHNPKHTMTKSSIIADKGTGDGLSDDWEWNSKRWRELFLVQDNTILEIKGYPYQDEVLSNAALMWLKELAYSNLGWSYNDEELNVQDCYNIDDENFYSITPAPTYFMYGDVGTLSKHRMRVNLDKLRQKCEKSSDDGFYDSCMLDYNSHKWHHIYTIPYGGAGTCMCCGGSLEEEENMTSMVLCQDCSPCTRCACCGEIIYDEDDMYTVEDCDGYICENCWENNVIFDDITQCAYLNDDSAVCEINWAPVVDEDGKCIVDNRHPVFYDSTFYTVEPKYNTAYLEIFNGPPKTISIGYNYYTYVTSDMIKDEKAFEQLFGIYWKTREEIEKEYQEDYCN